MKARDSEAETAAQCCRSCEFFNLALRATWGECVWSPAGPTPDWFERHRAEMHADEGRQCATWALKKKLRRTPMTTEMNGMQRAARRGADAMLFEPPEPHNTVEGWHLVHTHEGDMVLRWVPGIAVWRSADGLRWATETAGKLHWSYVRATNAPDGWNPDAAPWQRERRTRGAA